MSPPKQTASAFLALVLMLGVGGGWWLITRTPPADDADQVLIEPEEWQYAIADFTAATGRDATAEEKRLLLEGMVEDEILLAEGVRSAPWTTDPVIRRRLIQLVSFFDVREGEAGSSARAALLKRVEKYRILVGAEEFDIEDSLPRSAE